MSGLVTKYYAIKPTDELNQIILQMDEKIDYSWLKPRVWFNEETFFTDNDYARDMVKVAFLLEIISQRYWRNEDIIELVFGRPPEFSISTFDRLWTIERFEPGSEVWKVMMKAKAEDIKLIQMTGDSAIDKMLTDFIQYKEENNA